MQIKKNQLVPILQTAQRITRWRQLSQVVTATHPTSSANKSLGFQKTLHTQGETAGNNQNDRFSAQSLASRVAKYAVCIAGAGYVYDKTFNGFFLSTTSLHDGKGGFSSNDRLNKANAKAKEYYQHYHCSSPEEQKRNNRSLNPIRTCGSNQFVTMTDYRAATRRHVMELTNTQQARESLIKSLTCLKGHLVKEQFVAKYSPPYIPKNPDLTKSSQYEQKTKYALIGVTNDETGASGYTSRSITRPFVNKGMRHFINAKCSKGLTLKQCVESLEAELENDDCLGEKAQFAAGQAILNFRQVYAADEHWGHAEKVVIKTLIDHGLISREETEKIDATLMFEDPSKSVFKRNTGVMGPLLHKLDTRIQEFRLRNDSEKLEDFKFMAKQKNMENLPIAHFKLNERGNGFEDCSGLGDSFTSVNAIACINHARLMSGEERLSKNDVAVIVACLNAVYDDAGGIRHTLHEIARGCFVGAGYTTEDADQYYTEVCQKAAEEFYGGKNLWRGKF